jgi:ATP-binding cassette subfamily F protein 3
LLIVHDGIVDRFNRSLDDYPAWLREQEEKAEQALTKWKESPAKSVNRKQQRQEQAQRRKRLKPLYDKVRDVETDLASNRSRLAELEARLADEAIYANPDRQDELTQLVREQATIKSAIESLEGEWLEASEKLEQSS